MKSAYPSNYLLLMPKNKTSFTCTEQKKKKKSNGRKKGKPMASSGPHKRPMGIPEGTRNGSRGGGGLCHIDGDAVRMSLVWFLRCPALNLCAKSLSRQLLNSRMFCSCCVFLVSVLCRFLRQLSARLFKLPRLLGPFVPDKLCEAAPLSAQTRTHFDHFSSCNFV